MGNEYTTSCVAETLAFRTTGIKFAKKIFHPEWTIFNAVKDVIM